MHKTINRENCVVQWQMINYCRTLGRMQLPLYKSKDKVANTEQLCLFELDSSRQGYLVHVW